MASAEGGGDKFRSFLHGDGEKNTEWAEGSVEEKVQRLLKTWEMEMIHKVRPDDQKSFHSQNYSASTNGLKPLTREEVMAMGGYNAFLETTLPPEHRIYDPEAESVESATSMFLTAFPRGFAIEVLDVYSGPPRGPFKGHPPHGGRVEFFGVCVFHVDEEMKVEKAEYFYERGNFLASFLSAPVAASASGCPVMREAD
ncbi:hypothetical protein ZWY2020_005886 [Hordeum vulgare]|nr:hypothetical protein ZWY2020_005886 [Hordeum vulgare]